MRSDKHLSSPTVRARLAPVPPFADRVELKLRPPMETSSEAISP